LMSIKLEEKIPKSTQSNEQVSVDWKYLAVVSLLQ